MTKEINDTPVDARDSALEHTEYCTYEEYLQNRDARLDAEAEGYLSKDHYIISRDMYFDMMKRKCSFREILKAARHVYPESNQQDVSIITEKATN